MRLSLSVAGAASVLFQSFFFPKHITQFLDVLLTISAGARI